MRMMKDFCIIVFLQVMCKNCLQDFYFCLLRSLTVLFIHIHFLIFTLLRLCWSSWMCKFIDLSNLEKKNQLYLQPVLPSSFSSLEFWDFNSMDVMCFNIIPQVLEVLKIFQHFSSYWTVSSSITCFPVKSCF